MSARGRVGPGSCDGVSENDDGGLSAAKWPVFFFLDGERGQGSGERSHLEERRIGEVAPGRVGVFFFFRDLDWSSPDRDGSGKRGRSRLVAGRCPPPVYRPASRGQK